MIKNNQEIADNREERRIMLKMAKMVAEVTKTDEAKLMYVSMKHDEIVTNIIIDVVKQDKNKEEFTKKLLNHLENSAEYIIKLAKENNIEIDEM